MKEAERTTDNILNPWLKALKEIGHPLPGNIPTRGQQHPLPYLVSIGVKNSQEELIVLLGQYLGIPAAEFDSLDLDWQWSAETVPAGFARRHQIIALKSNEEEIFIACANPFTIENWKGDLSKALTKKIKPNLATHDIIMQHLHKIYNLQGSITQMTTISDPIAKAQPENPPESDAHAKFVSEWLLSCALEQKASDIHLEPRAEGIHIRLRVNGLLYTMHKLPHTAGMAVSNRLKVLGKMDISEKRLPQDGHLCLNDKQGDSVELRLSTLPTAYGEKLVGRLLSRRGLFRNLSSLGLDEESRQKWLGIVSSKGAALVTGPTGSGKTTTLYSTLKHCDDGQRNICTIEDPIEIAQSGFNQIQVHPSIGLNFPAGIRALLRQDPDIIMVGEIRDSETAFTAMQAALTGHQVLATLHTNDSLSSVIRLMELGVPDWLLRATLNGVLAQRMIKLLCPLCRRPTRPDIHDWRRIAGDGLPCPRKIFKAKGCTACRHTGVKNSVVLFEVLSITEALREHINPNTSTSKLRALALDAGIHSIRSQLIERLQNGEISMAEALEALSIH